LVRSIYTNGETRPGRWRTQASANGARAKASLQTYRRRTPTTAEHRGSRHLGVQRIPAIGPATLTCLRGRARRVDAAGASTRRTPNPPDFHFVDIDACAARWWLVVTRKPTSATSVQIRHGCQGRAGPRPACAFVLSQSVLDVSPKTPPPPYGVLCRVAPGTSAGALHIALTLRPGGHGDTGNRPRDRLARHRPQRATRGRRTARRVRGRPDRVPLEAPSRPGTHPWRT